MKIIQTQGHPFVKDKNKDISVVKESASTVCVCRNCVEIKVNLIIIIIIIFFFIPLVVKIPGVKRKKLKTDVSSLEWSEV